MNRPETIKPQQKENLADYDLFDAELMECPFHYWKQLRTDAPVFQDPTSGMFLISSYDLVNEVNRHPEIFSNRFNLATQQGELDEVGKKIAEIQSKGYPPVDTMLSADPPEHTRYRSLVNKAFSPKRVAQMEDNVEKISNEIIDAFIDDGEVEILTQYAQLLPLTVIAEQLGVSMEDRKKFRKWSDSFIVQLSRMAEPDRLIKAAQDILDFQNYFAEKLKEKSANPTEDIISDLTQVTLEDEGDPRGLNTAEQLSILQQLLVAGNETTAKAITEGFYYLISDPSQMEALYNDLDLIPNLIEETLRMLTPTNNMYRVVKQDTELGGVKIPAGSMAMIKYGCANRDEAKFDDGERFDIHRKNARNHMAFGTGIHTCLGNSLARKEMTIGYRTLFTRMKNWQFAEGKNDFMHSPNFLLRGMMKLHLTFDKA